MRPAISISTLLAMLLSIGLSSTLLILIEYQRRLLETITSQSRSELHSECSKEAAQPHADSLAHEEDSNLKVEELPGSFEEVLMVIQENRQFSLVNDTAWAATLPGTRGFVRLGPKGRSYGVAAYHQLHCINALRFSYTVARDGLIIDPDILKAKIGHDNHCFQFIRQSILCKADDTLIEVPNLGSLTLSYLGFGATHRCRNWAQVRKFVLDNSAEWKGIPYTTDEDAVVIVENH